MGDKSPRSKQREEKQKRAADARKVVDAKAKQARNSEAVDKPKPKG